MLKGLKNDKVLWQIEKKYDTFKDDSIGYKNIGKKVDVYVETINKIIPEYLVDFDLLERCLRKYGILLVDIKKESDIKFPIRSPTGSFEMLWKSNQMVNKSSIPNGEKKVFKSINEMIPVVKEYSFLNRWFIFKKYT